MQSVCLAILWHQHQPYYPDDLTGETLMPWVRLHGIKDYYGMALHLKEVPEFRCAINLVPSLLVQLQRYAEGGSDRHLDVSRLPADGLSEADARFVLDQFFLANLNSMIRPHSRYYELYLKRGFGIDPVEKALPRFSTQDLLDLQVCHNLAWFHPLLFEQDAGLREFRAKGQRWTEREKAWLLDQQLDVLRRIVPLHRQLAESGQVELTTTPFYHPILPLLWDKRSARQAMPTCKLPRYLDSYADDAQTQIRRAVEFHERVFGSRPAGLWPSEGSVSQDILAAIAAAGIEWIATDEEILAASTDGWVARDGHGHMRRPEMLYRPWRVAAGEGQLQIVFRDHALSDLIGFHYQRSDPVHAADDLLGRVEAIGRAVEPASGGRPALVSIILDGENCWEYYPDGGVAFLRTLYRRAAASKRIRPVRMKDHLQEYPATDRLTHLFAGSWISHNFAIWIGHQDDVTAWELLHQAREFLRRVESEAGASSAALARAWEEIYIAEGSDWFWWFGDEHHSAQDALFDQLFRKHLQNVYTLLDATPPANLSRPVSSAKRQVLHTHPTGFLPVKIDGQRTYFEWANAGRYTAGSERGTMALVTKGLITDVYFGFDVKRLFVRVDTARQALDDLADIEQLVVGFLEPADTELRVRQPAGKQPQCTLMRQGQPVPNAGIEFAIARIVELAVPFASLQIREDDPLQMFVELRAGRRSVDRAPREGTLNLVVPSADFERIMWQA